MPADGSSHPIKPVRLAPDSVEDFTDTFHAELCEDGMWGVVQTTRWQYREEDTWDCRGCWAVDQEACTIDYGLTEAEARATVARLSGEAVARAA